MPAPSGRQSTTAASSSGRRRCQAWRCSACCWRRASAPTSPPRASSRSPRRPGSAAATSSSTATTRARVSSEGPRRSVRRSSSTRRTRSSPPPPESGASWFGSHWESTPTRTRRSGRATTGSKFGLPPDQARAAVADALDRDLDVLGVHVGSQLEDFDAQAETIVRLAAFVAGCRDAGWTAQVADLGGGFGIRHHPEDQLPRRG